MQLALVLETVALMQLALVLEAVVLAWLALWFGRESQLGFVA